MIMGRQKNKLLVFSFLLSALLGCREYAYFLDMHYSPAVDSQKQDAIGNRAGNLLPPENTIPYKGSHYALTNALSDYPRADLILKSPFEDPTDAQVLDRGKEQYRIYCSPCHGLSGAGDGTVQAKWPSIRPLVAVEGREVPPLEWGVGRVYHVIRVGIRSMQGYATQIKEENRWAIAHYVKHLQKETQLKGQPIQKNEKNE